MRWPALLAVVLATGCAPSGGPPVAERPLVIAHRGASGYLPEHTLEAYALAIEQGADFIEPDLVMTRDGHLVVRHEPNIARTTDVKDRPEFASRRRVAVVDGVEEEGWFVCDFTLAEMKTLRAVQAFPERPRQHNGKFAIPTFDEVIELARRRSRETGRSIGVYPETKHPAWHRAIGLPLEEALVAALERAGWNRSDAPVFIQSFEQGNLRALRGMTKVRLVQLVGADGMNPDGSLRYDGAEARPWDWTASGEPRLMGRTYGFFATDEGLAEIAGYADVVAPWKRYIVAAVPKDPAGGAASEAELRLLPPGDFVERAHRHRLAVHTWTFRSEPHRLAADYGGDPAAEYLQFYRLGVDAVFSDFPDTAVAARDRLAGAGL